MSIEQIVCAILLFLCFYVGSMQRSKGSQFFFVLLFLLASLIMRALVDIDINKDFFNYYNLYRIEKPESWWEYIAKEPYLYLLHSFFYNIYDDKMEVFQAMYFFNYIVVAIFFVWLMTLKDISAWKKVFIFTLYYFLFSYTLLRNGIPYAIFGYFIYQIYRGGTTRWVYVTPFMHISSAVPILLVFHNRKRYMLYLLIAGISLLAIVFVGSTLLNRPEFALISDKIDAYGSLQGEVSVFHYIYFSFIVLLCFTTWIFTKKRFWNPVVMTTLFFYLIGFSLNPVVGFRFSPYLIMAVLLMNVNSQKYTTLNFLMNVGALALLGYFIFSLYDTHQF